MNLKLMRRLVALVPLLVLLVAAGALAQAKITTPKEFLGFDAGDDYTLANYTQLKAYWEKLAEETDRMKLVPIGKTAEGRPMIMAIFTSPENQKKFEYARDYFDRLNQWLKKDTVDATYQLNFLTPKDFNKFFIKLRKDEAQGFRSELDIVLARESGEKDFG